MATNKGYNFLIRRNEWLADGKQMNNGYYERALKYPEGANNEIAKVIYFFAREARKYEERRQGVQFANATIAREVLKYLIYN